MQNTEPATAFLLSVRQITRAETISLFCDYGNHPHQDILLLHDGCTPVPEFATTDTALACTRELLEHAETNTATEFSAVTVWKSALEKSYLLRIVMTRYFQTLDKTRNDSSQSDRRGRQLHNDHTTPVGELWLALNFAATSQPEFFTALLTRHRTDCPDPPETPSDWFVRLLLQGGAGVWQSLQFTNLFRDPTSRLPGRMEFQNSLKRILYQALQTKSAVAVILLNPDEFAIVNQRLGREQGDKALTEIADRLLSVLRHDDLVFRYGGAMFAIILPKTDKTDVNILTEKLRTSLSGTYLATDLHLTFSVGAALHQPDEDRHYQDHIITLVNRTEQALNLAKLSGGGKSVIWNKDDADSSLLSLDRLGNIFTSESEKDYRNMLLLWDTIAVISTGSDTQKIALEFVDRVKQTLRPFRIGLFEETIKAVPTPLATRYGQEQPDNDWQLSRAQQNLLEAVRQGKRTERLRFTDSNAGNHQEKAIVAFGFPLLVREQIFGYLYIDGPENVFTLDSSDLVFLNALTRQLALALDRAALERRWKEEKEKESRQLKQEVRELRQVIHSAKLIYRSTQMHALLETLSSVAPTDVTILITGESGTGKEMLARAVHEQSTRKKKPLITVDCGAIAHTLMEAELFGHVKGAYTGAQGASQGRFLQADGGTLFLDEIGELPLDVQAKLLRFVQEKEINPVGGGKTKHVDVRIIAATNRDLTEEVAAGRFRSDLYYRLQVITLTAPPLRERPDDIIPLARHFLEKFAVQYEKGMLHLTDEVEKALLAYPWPGNIRELQNTIMRAAVISKNEHIELDVLSLTPPALSHAAGIARLQPHSGRSDVTPPGIPVDQPEQLPDTQPRSETGGDIWEQLRANLHARLLAILDADKVIAVPLGRWLTEDLVLAADRFERGIARRASSRLGLAETTFRRQLEKLKQAEQAGVLSRTDDWRNIQPLLAELVGQLQDSAAENIIEQVRTILLQEIVSQIPRDKTLGSTLMGVTLPTYHRWLKKTTG